MNPVQHCHQTLLCSYHRTLKTYVILGNYRGGTSIFAGLLILFGIDMGHIDDVVYEDVRMRGNAPDVIPIIHERNKAGRTWGWKYPGAINYIGQVEPYLINPRYIVVFRDPYAIALTEQREINKPVLPSLATAYRMNEQLVKWYLDHDCYGVSVERFWRDRPGEIERLANYCDVELTDNLLDEALEFTSGGYSDLLRRHHGRSTELPVVPQEPRSTGR